MSAVKERILGAVTIMSDEDAAMVWDLIQLNLSPVTWENISEEEPDDIDLKMLDNIENNPDCKEFLSNSDAMKILELS